MCLISQSIRMHQTTLLGEIEVGECFLKACFQNSTKQGDLYYATLWKMCFRASWWQKQRPALPWEIFFVFFAFFFFGGGGGGGMVLAGIIRGKNEV